MFTWFKSTLSLGNPVLLDTSEWAVHQCTFSGALPAEGWLIIADVWVHKNMINFWHPVLQSILYSSVNFQQ